MLPTSGNDGDRHTPIHGRQDWNLGLGSHFNQRVTKADSVFLNSLESIEKAEV